MKMAMPWVQSYAALLFDIYNKYSRTSRTILYFFIQFGSYMTFFTLLRNSKKSEKSGISVNLINPMLLFLGQSDESFPESGGRDM